MDLRQFLSTLASSALLLALPCSAHADALVATQEEARAALENASAVVVDIREPREHATGVAKGALLIPMGQISQRIAELPKPDQKPLLVMCATQNRSSRLVAQLQAAGYTNARYVQGGMNQWTARGWPVVQP
ncbi:MAG: rhodanese-like domain-containing protein [Pseudomonadota bacterium]